MVAGVNVQTTGKSLLSPLLAGLFRIGPRCPSRAEIVFVFHDEGWPTDERRGSRVDYRQVEELLEGVKVQVTVKQ
jgi:hypothetical protein